VFESFGDWLYHEAIGTTSITFSTMLETKFIINKVRVILTYDSDGVRESRVLVSHFEKKCGELFLGYFSVWQKSNGNGVYVD